MWYQVKSKKPRVDRQRPEQIERPKEIAGNLEIPVYAVNQPPGKEANGTDDEVCSSDLGRGAELSQATEVQSIGQVGRLGYAIRRVDLYLDQWLDDLVTGHNGRFMGQAVEHLVQLTTS
jgi:hypothetical protein